MTPPLSNVLAPLCDGESKVQLFLIIINIHSPENLSALVWFRLGEKPRTSRTSSQKYVFQKMRNTQEFRIIESELCVLSGVSQWFQRHKTLAPVTDGLGVMSDLVLLIAVVPPSGRLGRALFTLLAVWVLPSLQVSSLYDLRFGLHDQFYVENADPWPF